MLLNPVVVLLKNIFYMVKCSKDIFTLAISTVFSPVFFLIVGGGAGGRTRRWEK